MMNGIALIAAVAFALWQQRVTSQRSAASTVTAEQPAAEPNSDAISPDDPREPDPLIDPSLDRSPSR